MCHLPCSVQLTGILTVDLAGMSKVSLMIRFCIAPVISSPSINMSGATESFLHETAFTVEWSSSLISTRFISYPFLRVRKSFFPKKSLLIGIASTFSYFWLSNISTDILAPFKSMNAMFSILFKSSIISLFSISLFDFSTLSPHICFILFKLIFIRYLINLIFDKKL